MDKDQNDDHVEAFELALDLPDSDMNRTSNGLIGFGARFERLKTHLQLLIDKEGLEAWSQKLYGSRIPMLDSLLNRYPLVIFHGDVGTGKTATAECVADALTRALNTSATLFKLSTRVRGGGNVGEMSLLINRAFDVVVRTAGKKRTSFLVIDEGDSLAANRNGSQSHHEDKVAVNTLTQRIDDLRRLHGRVLVILCTNRFSALDPAIIRRSGLNEEFLRPGDSEREALFQFDCEGLGLGGQMIRDLVALTGPQQEGGVGFTYSDIRTRLLPLALGKAFPTRKLTVEDFVSAARSITPSPSLLQDGA